MQRPPRVGVMGGGQASEAVREMAQALGCGIAERGWVLVTGGRDAGVMAAANQGAREAGGLTIGILPGRDPGPGVSEHVQVPVFTGMGDARNAINVLTSQVVVALPGGAGTLSEVALAVKAGRPVVLVGWPPKAGGSLPSLARDDVHNVEDVQAALALVGELLAQGAG